MPRICDYTGKISRTGNNVSHSNRHTKRTFLVNLHPKTLRDPKTGAKIQLTLSTNAIRTMRKKGTAKFLQEFGL